MTEGLTPASPDSLPPLGELIADEPFWRYRTGTAGEGVAHLRIWLTAGPEPGHLAVVTETGTAAGVTESAGNPSRKLRDDLPHPRVGRRHPPAALIVSDSLRHSPATRGVTAIPAVG